MMKKRDSNRNHFNLCKCKIGAEGTNPHATICSIGFSQKKIKFQMMQFAGISSASAPKGSHAIKIKSTSVGTDCL